MMIWLAFFVSEIFDLIDPVPVAASLGASQLATLDLDNCYDLASVNVKALLPPECKVLNHTSMLGAAGSLDVFTESVSA